MPPRRADAAPDGEDVSCETLLRTSAPLLAAYFARRVGHGQADLDDLVQEALIAVYLHRAHYDRTRPFRGWLFGIARHKMVDYFRSRRAHLQLSLIDDTCAVDGFEAQASARMDIERLLRALPHKQARVIRDTQIDGLTSSEAASRRGIGESDVRVSVHRGVKAMRRSIGIT
ncbi:sigma-70 family RNA polymerase sigma factor [Dyella telluris]|uniref:Sigma-70 family RNA polymerase sigma factor n=1 Tax=Dyella telluris TaxID=2763498 RepID=A0A7G8Q3Q9_9GAMM|nr:sigma-70 family RNA polymerase sigma factor [Dyella telluris]QNK01417.1 sigma-70 family RNA polymerase sigma factor [Dyella telluris]